MENIKKLKKIFDELKIPYTYDDGSNSITVQSEDKEYDIVDFVFNKETGEFDYTYMYHY